MATPSEKLTDNAVVESQKFDLNAPEWYLNRELTWLEFNRRVLHEAEDIRTPLLERLKFIAIVSSNLDEFFMKRIGGLKEQVGACVQELTVDGRSPQQQIDECYEVVREIESQKDLALPVILKELKAYDIEIIKYSSLSKEQKTELRAYYIDNIFPLVTPQSVDPAHPFPFISNLSLNLLVTLRNSADDSTTLARVKVPVGTDIPRFLRIDESNHFITLEEVMRNNLDLLFPEIEIVACELFHVTRNANTARDETKADDLLALIESEVRDRKFARIVRVAVEHGMDTSRQSMLAAELALDVEKDVFETKGLMALRDLFELASIENPGLHDAPHHSVEHSKLQYAPRIFHAIREAGSILLQHPYETFFSSVERFVREASVDPKVRAIKMTIYRTSSESKILGYLMDAARHGKQVAVVVELKARFDESANIRWASRLEEVGIHVTYGVVGYKTHCKVMLVVRQDYDGLRHYAHISTGNYHAGTAKIYSDLGLFTCDKIIGHDLTELFNYLTTGYTPKRNYKKILPAPTLLKKSLINKIQREAENHKAGKPALIQMKMNALEDADITRHLYEASQAGVTINLIVRDTCRLRPGIKGLSENITIIGIVGRFLEHARIYYFKNDGKEEYYIGSADSMMRNLEQRIEILVPVEEPSLRTELRNILDINLNDQRSAWEMQSDGTYIQRQSINAEALSCQEKLMQLAEERSKAEKKKKKQKKKTTVRRRNIIK